MKIELRKVPTSAKEFSATHNSVKIEGTFCKISPSLVRVDAKLMGPVHIACDRCAKDEAINLDEKLDFLISDGIFNDETDELVIEVEDSFIDFDEIILSELSSIQSDYHLCKECEQKDKTIEQEF